MTGALLAYDLDRARSDQILEGVKKAPRYSKKWGAAVRTIVHSIHSIPRLHGSATLGHIEVYVGRSYPEGVERRFEAHRNGRKHHRYGMVVCRCRTEHVPDLERLGVRLVKLLKSRGSLCVANIAADDRGRLPSAKDAVIYLTWKVEPPRPVATPTRRDCDELVRRLGDYEDINYSRHMIRWGIDDISRPKTARRWVNWHRRHRGKTIGRRN